MQDREFPPLCPQKKVAYKVYFAAYLHCMERTGIAYVVSEVIASNDVKYVISEPNLFDQNPEFLQWTSLCLLNFVSFTNIL